MRNRHLVGIAVGLMLLGASGSAVSAPTEFVGITGGMIKLDDSYKTTVNLELRVERWDGRVKKGIPQRRLSQLGQILAQEIPQVGHLVELSVEKICLIRSDLKPDGPVYTSLAHGILKGN